MNKTFISLRSESKKNLYRSLLKCADSFKPVLTTVNKANVEAFNNYAIHRVNKNIHNIKI